MSWFQSSAHKRSLCLPFLQHDLLWEAAHLLRWQYAACHVSKPPVLRGRGCKKQLCRDRGADVHHHSCQASTWTCVRCRWFLNLFPRLLAIKKTPTEQHRNTIWCKTTVVFYFLESFCNVFELATLLSLAAIANPSMSLAGVLDTLN